MEDDVKSILCFGDSNTYGVNPEDETRYPFSKRWTGILESLLGPGYRIIEEGLCGRTTVFHDPFSDERRGLDAVDLVLDTHAPLDLVVIMLGTNDARSIFSASPRSIAKGMERLINAFLDHPYPEWAEKPEILIVSPIHAAEDVENSIFADYDHDSYLKILALSPLFAEIASRYGLHFLDASQHASCGSDKIHIDEEGHRRLAEALSLKIRTIIG